MDQKGITIIVQPTQRFQSQIVAQGVPALTIKATKNDPGFVLDRYNYI